MAAKMHAPNLRSDVPPIMGAFKSVWRNPEQIRINGGLQHMALMLVNKVLRRTRTCKD
jgi:hypothetical protein